MLLSDVKKNLYVQKTRFFRKCMSWLASSSVGEVGRTLVSLAFRASVVMHAVVQMESHWNPGP